MNPLCVLRRQALARYAALGRTLPAGSRLARHLARCEGCRAAWDDLRHLASELARALTMPAAADAFTERVWVRIGAEGRRRQPGPLGRADFLREWRRPMAWAAMGLAGMALFGIWLRGAAWREVRSAPPRVSLAPLREHGMVSGIPKPLPLRKGAVPDRALAAGRMTAPGRGRRLKPRQGKHEVRLRGLPSQSAKADFVPLVPRFQPTAHRSGLAPGPGDLIYLNEEPAAALRHWGRSAVEPAGHPVRLAPRPRGDDFVSVPLPQIAAAGPMGDRSAAEAADTYRREAAVVDARLSRKVTLAAKATALSDVCDHLRSDTGIQLGAGQSVADEKVTLFCRDMPLRDVMRQLSRPFGYTWLRSGKQGEYRYELVQDLRSQLLEEELRNRDRNEAVLALDREMQRYRKYLDLSPDEALARSQTAPPGEKKLLEHYAGSGWGVAQLYFRLSPQELAALRAGQRLTFSAAPKSDKQPLPADVARGVLQSLRDRRVVMRDDRFEVRDIRSAPEGLPPASVPEARARVSLWMVESELGQFLLDGDSGFSFGTRSGAFGTGSPLATGVSPTARDPRNGVANARMARDPALRPRITVQPVARCWTAPPDGAAEGAMPAPRVRSADVLEDLYRATGLPIVADYYTRLYDPGTVLVRNQPRFEALNQLADAMRLRWTKEGDWLRFRSATFFNDRIKEVPNRLLRRWSASRQEHGALTLDDLIEIAGLSDAQLNGAEMAEGARICFGLAEWHLVSRRGGPRRHLRFMSSFTPEQRRMATSAAGLAFTRLSLAQQQQFLDLVVSGQADRLSSLTALAGASMRVDYELPGRFQWVPPPDPDRPFWRTLIPSPVREPTREAALQAARRIDPQATEAQIVPTERALTFLYTLDRAEAGVENLFALRTDESGNRSAGASFRTAPAAS